VDCHIGKLWNFKHILFHEGIKPSNRDIWHCNDRLVGLPTWDA
jgi:hypothetical protein